MVAPQNPNKPYLGQYQLSPLSNGGFLYSPNMTVIPQAHQGFLFPPNANQSQGRSDSHTIPMPPKMYLPAFSVNMPQTVPDTKMLPMWPQFNEFGLFFLNCDKTGGRRSLCGGGRVRRVRRRKCCVVIDFSLNYAKKK